MTKFDFSDMNSPDPSKHTGGEFGGFNNPSTGLDFMSSFTGVDGLFGTDVAKKFGYPGENPTTAEPAAQ